jgi:uncharacterized protein with PIN domain
MLRCDRCNAKLDVLKRGVVAMIVGETIMQAHVECDKCKRWNIVDYSSPRVIYSYESNK